MATIDLGEVTGTAFEPPRPAPRRLIRPTVLALVALLTVVTVTASTTIGPPRGVRPLWSAPLDPTDAMFLDAGTVFVNRAGTGAGLTAYDVATGAARWTADPAGTGAGVGDRPDLVTAGGVVLVPGETTVLTGVNTSRLFTSTTVAVDETTGARLWKQDAGRVHIAGDLVLMAEPDATGRAVRLRMTRLRDGGTVWSRALTANAGVAASDDTVVTVDDHGGVTVLRWADGSVRTARTLSGRFDPQHDGLSVAGDVLIIGWSGVYRLDSLAEAWHSDGDVGDCAPVLCASEGDVVVGRDPLTGAERWRLPGVTSAVAIGSGRLLADTLRDTDGPLLVDADTGRTVAALDPGQPAWPIDPRGPLVMVDSDFVAPPHVSVIQIDRATGEQFPLGALAWMGDGNPNCQAVSGYLACPGHDRLYVTAVG